MKTPRELLLEKNQSAMPHLDAARRRAIATLDGAEPVRRAGFAMSRWLRWAPLASVWLCIGLMQWHGSLVIRPAESLPRSVERELTLNARANRQLLFEAIDDSVEQTPRLPGPRTSFENNDTLIIL